MKLTIIYSSFFLLISIPVAVSYYYFTLAQIKEDVRKEFASSKMVFRTLLRLRTEQISDSVRLLTQDFGFREAVATHDAQTIASALDNLKKRLKVGWGVVVDADGKVIAGASPSQNRYYANRLLLSTAEDRGAASDIAVINGAVQQVVAMPVLAPELVGWAVFGLNLDTSELQSMSDMSPLHFDSVILYTDGDGKWIQAPVAGSASLGDDVFDFVLRHLSRDNRRVLEAKGGDGNQLLLISALPVAHSSHPVALVLRVRLRDVLARFESLFYVLVIIATAGFILLTIGSWVLSVGVTRPLRRLAAAAREFGQGRYSELRLQNRSDEIGHLASSFSIMASEIENRTRQLREANAGLESRVAERSKQLTEINEKLMKEIEHRKRSEEALRVSKTKAEQANRAKDDFLATMSHELRTPMNGIMGIVHYLKNAEMPNDARKNLDILEESAHSLLTILNDVLDFAKIESGKIDIQEEAFSLYRVITGLEDLWRAAANDKGLEFRIEARFDEDAIFIGDKTRIRQIINNYLNNAVKFTEEGVVTLAAEVRETGGAGVELRLSVTDTGVGIRPDEIPMLFEKFSQLEGGKARRFGGTGLGLAICRRLARAMGGEVGVDSTPGEGSEFWCVLPLSRANETAILEKETANGGAAKGRGASTRKDLRILLVEDNDINVRVMSLFIEQLGYTVSEVARNGVDAVDLVCERGDFDVVLMDLRMPKMDGLEATRRIRNAGFSAAELPIIALTADTMESDRRACIEAGMTDFIGKPVSPNALSAALIRASESHVGQGAAVA